MEDTLAAGKTGPRSFLQSVLRAVVPKDDRFYDFLEEQAGLGSAAAGKLAELSTNDLLVVVKEVQEIERQGDAAVHRLEEALAATFVTPLDREDIQKLSSELDNVLDYANAAARSCWMRGVDRPTAPMVAMIKLLGSISGVVQEAVSNLRRHDFATITALARRIREMESEGDRCYRDAIYALNHDDSVDVKRLRREEKVLEDLEAAMNHAEDLADMLINLAVKHG